jgi:hypothetical protein
MNKDEDRAVRYRCTSRTCEKYIDWRNNEEAHLNVLRREGCPACGSKRLEIWDNALGHVLADWRSPKSVRKKKRQALRGGLRL